MCLCRHFIGKQKEIYGLSGFSAYLGSRYCFYIPKSIGLNYICYIDLFQYLYIWSYRNTSLRPLLFSKRLRVVWIPHITLPHQTRFELSLGFVLHNEELYDLYLSPNISVIKSGRTRRAGKVAVLGARERSILGFGEGSWGKGTTSKYQA